MKQKNFGPFRSREELERIAKEICDYVEGMYPHLYGMQLNIDVQNRSPETIWIFRSIIGGNEFVQKFAHVNNVPPFDSVNQIRYMAEQFIAYISKEVGTVPDKALIDLLQELL